MAFERFASCNYLGEVVCGACGKCKVSPNERKNVSKELTEKYSIQLGDYKLANKVADKLLPKTFKENFGRDICKVASHVSVKAANGKISKERLTPLSDEFFYGRAMAVHGDLANNNGDLFRWGSKEDRTAPELLRYEDKIAKHVYQTFVGKGFYRDHKNDSVIYSKGILLDSIPNYERKGVEVLFAVDKKKDPDLVRGLELGYITDVSMGCRVGYSICSICGNEAQNETQYCQHVRLFKGGQYSGPETKGERLPVYEDNRNVEFIELSAVNVGADSWAKVLEKIASKFQTNNLMKIGLELVSLAQSKQENEKRIVSLLDEARMIMKQNKEI